MDITLQLQQCKTRSFRRNCFMSSNFNEGKWSARSPLQPGIPGVWPDGLQSEFSSSGDFEVKDNGVIWVWDQRSRTRGFPERLNTMIIRDAPTSESDTGHVSGTVRLYDPPSPQFKDLEFPWERSGAVTTRCCGPDVTDKLIGVLKTVIADYQNPKTSGVKQWAGMGFWNIDVPREHVDRITPPGTGCPKGSDCEGTVTVFGKCFRAGIVNYVLYGVIEDLTSNFIGDALHTIYWSGKVIANIATLNVEAANEMPHIGWLECKMVNAGVAFSRGGRSAMQDEILSIPSLACVPSRLPPKPYPWRYTWAPEFMDRLSRF